MKKNIKSFLNKIGIDIKRINPELKNKLSFDDIYKLKLKDNPTIIDVGANKGQSIKRFKKIFPMCTIHSFEPNFLEYKNIKEKFKSDKSININNFALGEKEEIKSFNITAKSGNSSFNKINFNTKWLKKRAKQFGVSEKEYTKSVVDVNVVTLDNYCKNQNISQIDILKIDTQGYEDKVLEGSQKILEKNILSIIEMEIILDNIYDKYLTFSDVEKYLLKNKFRLSGITAANNNIFEGLVFFVDVMYFNTKIFDLNNIK